MGCGYVARKDAPVTMAAAPDDPRREGARAPSALQQVQDLLRELPHLLSDRVELLALELQRAGQALARIVVFVVAAAVLLLTAWLAAWAVAFLLLLAVGMPPIGALVFVLLVNALAAWICLTRAHKLVGLLSLPATRRHLTVSPATKPAAEPLTEHALHRAAPPDPPTQHAAPTAAVPPVHDTHHTVDASTR